MDSMEFSVEELVSFVEELPPEETLQAYEKGGTDFSAHSEQLEGKPKQKIRSTKTKSGRTTNVDRCRKYRDKRRKEEAQVYTENFELKQQRTELQRQIAELEVEVQTLRGQGVVNLSKENELLRREIEVGSPSAKLVYCQYMNINMYDSLERRLMIGMYYLSRNTAGILNALLLL